MQKCRGSTNVKQRNRGKKDIGIVTKVVDNPLLGQGLPTPITILRYPLMFQPLPYIISPSSHPWFFPFLPFPLMPAVQFVTHFPPSSNLLAHSLTSFFHNISLLTIVIFSPTPHTHWSMSHLCSTYIWLK